MVEGIKILRELWTGQPVTHAGRYYRFENVQIHATPLQNPCPIPIAANPMPPYADEAMIERALRRVAQVGDGWMVEMSTPDEFGRRWRRIREYAQEAGRGAPDLSMIHFYVNVQEHAAPAWDEAVRFYESYHMGHFPEEYLRWRLVTGTPEQVVERIAPFLDAGCTLPIVRFASWDPIGQMRLAMERVFPALHDHADRLTAPAPQTTSEGM
jgi:alkanesulfonate monooxygenase SsuD/methylene tetrahydromethanopterin reductase-like flavin-dependent oxidoreductase (luciferase family)